MSTDCRAANDNDRLEPYPVIVDELNPIPLFGTASYVDDKS